MPLNDQEREQLQLSLFDIGLKLCGCAPNCLSFAPLGDEYSPTCQAAIDAALIADDELGREISRGRGGCASVTFQRSVGPPRED